MLRRKCTDCGKFFNLYGIEESFIKDNPMFKPVCPKCQELALHQENIAPRYWGSGNLRSRISPN